MIKLEIISIDRCKYTIQNTQTGKTLVHSFEFYDLPQPLKVGDIIIMHKELLDPNYSGYSSTYSFGDLDDKSGRNVSSSKDIDAIAVLQGKKTIPLKRLYG